LKEEIGEEPGIVIDLEAEEITNPDGKLYTGNFS